MPHYMFQGRYTTASLKAMVDSPQDREAAAGALVKAMGGKLHSFFFCFGSEDVVAIIEAPDDTAMAACALAVGASGSMSGGATTKLLSSSDAKKAMKQAGKLVKSYQPASG